jgi:hypothetical protein
MKRLMASLFVLLGAATAYAGQEDNWPVTLGATSASGSVSSVHDGPLTDHSMIGCFVAKGWAGCYASDASGPPGSYKSCSSSVPSLIAAARMVNADSYISFAWNGFGACTSIVVDNSSRTPALVKSN